MGDLNFYIKAVRKLTFLLHLLLLNNVSFAQSNLPIDSMTYFLSQLNENRVHDSILVVNAMTIIDVKILSSDQFSKADSIVERYKEKMGIENYFAFKYDLNFGLVMANKHKEAIERIMKDIEILKTSDNEYLTYLLAQNFMELRISIRNSDKIYDGIKLYLQWIDEYEQKDDSVIVSTLYHCLRGFYSTLGLFDKSYDTHKKCIQFLSKHEYVPDKHFIDFGPTLKGKAALISQKWIMASVYVYNGLLEEGAAILYELINNYESKNQLVVNGPAPDLYMELFSYQSITRGDSINYYRGKCEQELSKIKDFPILYMHFYQTLANDFYLNNQLDSAEIYIKKSIFIQDSLGSGVSNHYGTLLTGYFYSLIKTRQNKFKEVIPILLNEIELLKQSNLRMDVLKEYELLSDVYKAMGDYKNATYVLEKYKALKDDITKDEIKNRSVSFEIEQSILKQKKFSESLLLENERNKKAKFVFIGISLFVLIIAYGLLKNVRLKRKIEMEKMRSRLSRDLHDDIGSTLSSINILSRTAQSNLRQTNNERTRASLEKINERSQRLLDSMSDIIWNINPGNDTFEEVMSRMREYATTLLEAKNIEYEFNFPKGIINCKLTMEVKNNMYLIFKEGVNNLSKYSGCTKVNLSLSFDDENIHLKIEDNGIGFVDSEVKHRGGLKNMQHRAQEIKGKIQINSVKNYGTIIELSMPRYC